MGEQWLTHKKVTHALGDKKVKELLNDLVYEKRSSPEILEEVMKLTGCNEYSASDFLRALVKSPPK